MKSRNRISVMVLILAVGVWVAPSALSESPAEPVCILKSAVVSHGESRLMLAPPCVQLRPGEVFTISIVPPLVDLNTAETKGQAKKTGPGELPVPNPGPDGRPLYTDIALLGHLSLRCFERRPDMGRLRGTASLRGAGEQGSPAPPFKIQRNRMRLIGHRHNAAGFSDQPCVAASSGSE